MGMYLNPGNRGFETIRNGVYVDKSGLIDYVNGTINTPQKLTCFSRPRRFGKSFAAKMLCAYYDNSCDSRELFQNLEISQQKSYEEHLNRYDVIYLDITRFISTLPSVDEVVKCIQTEVIAELAIKYPSCVSCNEKILANALFSVSHQTKKRFIIIIDEWDALFREAKYDQNIQKEYVQLLRGLFKGGTTTDETIAAAYMTGILPIKKYGTESALTDFTEFTMTEPFALAEYIGFTEQEVIHLCDDYHVDFDNMKQWYDGYGFDNLGSVYNPNSVMKAVNFKRIKNYWTQTETFESLKEYIGMDFDGLKRAIIEMLGGMRVSVKISTFQNDLTSFQNKHDVLTLLIHLGYLAYDSGTREAYIPNLEVAEAFESAIDNDNWGIVGEAVSDSEKLLEATLKQDEDAVAEALEVVHDSVSSVLQYNNESSLSCAVTIAYYTAKRYYNIVRELPAGKGFADLAFIPRRNVDKPAMIVELKYNKDADTAIRQIHENRYDGNLKEYFGNLLLVGINYDRDAKGAEMKQHSCVIEKLITF
ncbi:MAG: ATP-binding protein [Lachnospiraceae bacterium]|nr:ATP-binding protein [Lachnospiraceae bacterium]